MFGAVTSIEALVTGAAVSIHTPWIATHAALVHRTLEPRKGLVVPALAAGCAVAPFPVFHFHGPVVDPRFAPIRMNLRFAELLRSIGP